MDEHGQGTLRRALAGLPRAAGAPVMGTGIVSVAFALDGHAAVADVLLGVALLLAVLLAALLMARARRDRAGLAAAARLPAALTVPAAACVVGARLTEVGLPAAGAALLAAAAIAWAPLLARVLRAWRTPTAGDGFLVAVATQAIAVLGAALAVRLRLPWLAVVALAALVAGIALYVVAAASFDRRQIVRGRGDQWVAGGALAIAALAAADADAALRATGATGALLAPLRSLAFGLWVLAMAWLPVLVAGELRRPRAGLHPSRWSTVFPVGMYATMSFAVGHAGGGPAILTFARAWVWVAGAVWAVVAAGSAGTALRRLGAAPRMRRRAMAGRS